LTKFAKFLLSDKREFFAAYLSQEALNFGWWKNGEIWDLWQSFCQSLHFL